MNTKEITIDNNSNDNILQDGRATNYGRQPIASPEEAAERAAQLKTQGRKGCKAIRINMAFTPENHEYIRMMSRCTGTTMTEFINIVIDQYKKDHEELYDQAKDIFEKINKLSK